MTRRGTARPCRPWRRAALRPAVLTAAALLLAGCAGGGTGPERDGAPARSGGGGGPGDAAEAYFEAVGKAQFGRACALLAPAVRERYAAAGQDCRTELAETFDERTRDAIGDVAVDAERVTVTGDTAEIPGASITRTDLPRGADAPRFPDLRASLQGGAWYLLP